MTLETAPAYGRLMVPECHGEAPAVPIAEELRAKCASFCGLWRQLVAEGGSLLRLVVCAATSPGRARLERALREIAAWGVPSEAPAAGDARGRSVGRFADVSDDDVAEGERRLAAAGGVAASTRRAYESTLRGLDAWMGERRRGRPLTDAALAEYLAMLLRLGRSVASARQVVAAVKWRAKQRGEASPAGERTAAALLGYGRAFALEGAQQRGQVRGISWDEADHMRDLAAGAGDARGLRDAAMIAVASDALLRVSEVSNTQVADVSFEDDGTARLLVRRGKTDRAGRGEVLFLGERTAALVRAWTETAGIAEGALFRRIHRGGRVSGPGLGAASVRRAIIRRAAEAGIEGRVSGHSLRVGAAQSLAERGAGLVAMQKAGRWASPQMPARYTRSQAAAHGAVARLRYSQGVAGTPSGRSLEKK